MNGVKELECGDRVIVLRCGVVMVVVGEVSVHESENEMVRDKGGGWRCPRIWTGEKDGEFGESTRGVGGEGGVEVDGVIGGGGANISNDQNPL